MNFEQQRATRATSFKEIVHTKNWLHHHTNSVNSLLIKDHQCNNLIREYQCLLSALNSDFSLASGEVQKWEWSKCLPWAFTYQQAKKLESRAPLHQLPYMASTHTVGLQGWAPPWGSANTLKLSSPLWWFPFNKDSVWSLSPLPPITHSRFSDLKTGFLQSVKVVV